MKPPWWRFGPRTVMVRGVEASDAMLVIAATIDLSPLS
jgi:hypothetical protein